MFPKFKKSLAVIGAILVLAMSFLAGCEYSSDGPIKPSRGDLEFDGNGYFLGAALDSGNTFHLASDSLILDLKKIWTFSNCALKAINLDYETQGNVLWISPIIDIHVTEDECAAPYNRPDTTFRLSLEGMLDGVKQINVKNDADSLMDSILVRYGRLVKDTFSIYVDSIFSDAHNFPLRTKELKGKDSVPTILRVLDSLTPRVFYWRTMRSSCTHRIDLCDDVVADTIYPSSWNISDTNLVPVRYSCADTNLIYCINNKWENDSSALGKLQERPDTIWHYSTYLAERIPKCASYNSFAATVLGVGQNSRFIRELMIPDEDESACGPASAEEWMFYNLSNRKMVLDNDSVQVVDGLIESWKKADVAPDTLIVKDE